MRVSAYLSCFCLMQCFGKDKLHNLEHALCACTPAWLVLMFSCCHGKALVLPLSLTRNLKRPSIPPWPPTLTMAKKRISQAFLHLPSTYPTRPPCLKLSPTTRTLSRLTHHPATLSILIFQPVNATQSSSCASCKTRAPSV